MRVIRGIVNFLGKEPEYPDWLRQKLREMAPWWVFLISSIRELNS